MTAALGACAPEVVVDGGSTDSSPSPIGFTARELAGKDWAATRGQSVNNVGELIGADRGFYTWTYRHTNAWPDAATAQILVEGRVVSASNAPAKWTYGTRSVFWPEALVSSFAIAPHNSGAVVADLTTGTAPSVKYTVPDPGPTQCDLMFARAVRNATFEACGGQISHNFHHALARVRISAVRDGNRDVPMQIEAVRLAGIKTGGVSSLDAEMSWDSSASGAVDWEFSVANNRLNQVEVGKVAQEILSSEVGVLFAMPQQLDGARLEVDLVVDGWPETRVTPLTGQTWQPGRGYNYVIGVDTGILQVEAISVTEFVAVGAHTFVVPATGYYAVEAWGGNGGAGGKNDKTIDGWAKVGGAGGTGSYSAGVYRFEAGQAVTVQVGAVGAAASQSSIGLGGAAAHISSGGNGGQRCFDLSQGGCGGGGGAASVIFAPNGTTSVLVAAGGGGGGGGAAAYSNGAAGGSNGSNGSNGTTGGNESNNYGLGGLGHLASTDGGAGTDAQKFVETNGHSGGGGGGGGGYNGNGGGGAGGNGGHGFYYGSGGGGAAGASFAEPDQGRFTLIPATPPARSTGDGAVRISRLR